MTSYRYQEGGIFSSQKWDFKEVQGKKCKVGSRLSLDFVREDGKMQRLVLTSVSPLMSEGSEIAGVGKGYVLAMYDIEPVDLGEEPKAASPRWESVVSDSGFTSRDIKADASGETMKRIQLAKDLIEAVTGGSLSYEDESAREPIRMHTKNIGI